MKGRLPLLLVAGLVVVGIAAAIVAGVAAGTGFSPAAFTVNGQQVSQSVFNDELQEISKHPVPMATLLGTPVKATDGSITAEATTTWLDIRIALELLRQAGAKKGVALTAADRRRAERLLEQNLQSAQLRTSDLGSRVTRHVVDYFAYRQTLGLDTTAAYNAFLVKAVRDGDISVDPRYGSFGPRGLCPAYGCTAAAASGG